MRALAETHRSLVETHRSATDSRAAGGLALPIAELVVGVVAAASSRPMTTGAVAVSLAIAGVGARIDVREQTVPDIVVLGSSMPSLAVILAETAGGAGTDALAGAALGLLAFAGPLLAAHLVAPVAIGFGDVKLAASLGAALGLVDWRAAMVALLIASAATAGIGLVRRASEMPFAPGLVVGSVVALIVATSPERTGLPWY